MPAKVGRRGILTLLMLVVVVSLLPPSAAWGAAAPSPNLSLNLPGRVPTMRLAPTGEGPSMAWVITGPRSEAFQAAHAFLAEATVHRLADSATHLIVVRVRVATHRVRSVLTNATTVGELAEALPGRSRRSDIVRPSRQTTLRPHMLVRITKVRQARETVREDLPFETLIQYSRDVAPGEIRVLTPGRAGRAKSTYLVTYRNGRRVGAELVSQDILVEPIDQVEVHSVVEPSIARSAAGATGVEYGQATWYACPGMHAAHKTLPFGTVVMVTNVSTGSRVTVTINDRGPYAEGRIIDLCDGAFAQIAPLGQGVVDVKISF